MGLYLEGVDGQGWDLFQILYEDDTVLAAGSRQVA